jgi:thiamine biosynthesis lipoprotein
MLRLATRAMGTRFELVLGTARSSVRSLAPYGEDALDIVEECDRRFSLFRADSWLAHVNRVASRSSVALDEDTFELLDACDRVHRESSGAFDVTVAPLMRALGFHGEAGDVEEAREAVGWSAVELDRAARTLRFRREGVALDLGAIAKGHALDLAARRLRECGVASALLHGGTSSVIALGAPPGRDAWSIAIEGGESAAVVDLCDAALSVSAQHGRRLANGAGHVLDPRTRSSCERDDVVAVAHRSARIADAWSTAILVLGEAPPAPRDLDVAIGSGERFRRAWRFGGASSTRFRLLRSVPASTIS